MQDSLGARLRRRREEQQIALTAIAEQTKIKPALLEGLERDDLAHWPSGLYRRAFIRAYAQAIGLDPDTVLREFLDVHPEPADVTAAAALAATVESGGTNGGPPNRLRSMVGSAFSRLRRAPAVEPLVPIMRDDHAKLAAGTDAREEIVQSHPTEETEAAAAAEAVAPAPTPEAQEVEPDLSAVARLCTQFCRVEHPDEVRPLLQEAARILEATGIIVWLCDAATGELRAALAHGYPDRVLAQLPTVGRDADNATAAAFRTAHARTIKGTDHASGALVVPLITPGGCGGVLAIELPHGREQTKSVRAIAAILAAVLAQLLGGTAPAGAVDAEENAADDTASYKPAAVTH